MLDEAHLFYATNEHKGKPKRRIPVADMISVKEVVGGNVVNGFEITLRKQKRKNITLRANSHEDLQKWIDAINGVITHSTTE